MEEQTSATTTVDASSQTGEQIVEGDAAPLQIGIPRVAPQAAEESQDPAAKPVPTQLGRRVPTYEEIRADLEARGVSVGGRSGDVQAVSNPATETNPNSNPYTVSLVLGGKTYTIPKLVSKRAREWRGSMRAPLDEILSVMNGFQSFQIEDVQDLITIIRSIKDVVLAAPDTIIDLVFQYSPYLNQRKDSIMDEAYDEEFFAAFVTLAKVAFPLDQLKQFLGPSKVTTPSS